MALVNAFEDVATVAEQETQTTHLSAIETAVEAIQTAAAAIETATEAIQAAVEGTLDVGDAGGSLTVDGPVTDTQIRATPLPVSGTVTVTDGSGSLTVDGTVTANAGTGPFPVSDNGGSLTVDGTVTVQDGGSTISVDDGAGSLTVDGTVAATQSGTWTVQPGNTANTTAWKVDGSAVTQPVSDAGGSLTVDGAVTATPPVYTAPVCGELQGATSATQLPSVACKMVQFRALGDNAGKVYLGGSGVTLPNGTTDTTTGLELAAGQSSGWIPIDNLNRLYRICNNAGDDLTYLAMN